MSGKRETAALALLTLVFSLIPLSAHAACAVSALDTIAGLGSEITLTGCTPSTSISVRITDPSGAVNGTSVTTDEVGNGSINISSDRTGIAGIYSVEVDGLQTRFTVLADRPSDTDSMLVTDTVQTTVDGTVSASALLRDKFGNPVSGRPMALVSSRAADDIVSTSGKTDSNGRITWQVRAGVGGQMTLSVYDVMSGRQMKLSKTIMVGGGSVLAASLGMGQSDSVPLAADLSNGVVNRFVLSLPDGSTTVSANELFSLRLKAVDSNNQTVRSYVGSLYVQATDPDAELPKKGLDAQQPTYGIIDMLATFQGEREVPLSFLLRRTGTQTVTVYDKNNPSVRGEISLRVGGKGSSTQTGIEILDPVPGATVGSHMITVSGRAPSFVNLQFRGGLETVSGESDAEGVFSVRMEFAEDATQATVVATSENGTYEATATYTIDRTAPTIQSITINPTEGRTGDPATVTVVSEAGLATVTARVGAIDVPLSATSEDPTKYTGVITAPEEPGVVDVSVEATDIVGNQSAVTKVMWTVVTKEIPIVQNVQAVGQAQQVALSWDAVGGVDVREYKVYISTEDEPENYLYSIATSKPVTSAVLKDLPLGVTYLFSLTAIDKEGNESTEKSVPAVASPLGTRLTVTPGDASLRIEWNKIANLPLSHYVLRYGVDPTELTEQRSINGEAESAMLRDLLSGVMYYLELTPIAVNGQTRADLTVKAEGTPTGKGFIAGTSDPVPDDTFTDLHSGAPKQPVYRPSVPSTGVPTTLFWSILVLSLVLFGAYARHVRSERLKTSAFLEMMQNRYHR